MKTLHDWALAGCVDLLGLPLDEAETMVHAAEQVLYVVTLTSFGRIPMDRAKPGGKHLLWMAVLEEVAKVYELDFQELQQTCVWE